MNKKTKAKSLQRLQRGNERKSTLSNKTAIKERTYEGNKDTINNGNHA